MLVSIVGAYWFNDIVLNTWVETVLISKRYLRFPFIVVWVLVCQQKLPHRKMFMGYMMGSMVGMSVAGYVYKNMVSKLFTLGVALHFGFLRSSRRGGCGCSGSCCCVRPFLSDKNSTWITCFQENVVYVDANSGNVVQQGGNGRVVYVNGAPPIQQAPYTAPQ